MVNFSKSFLSVFICTLILLSGLSLSAQIDPGVPFDLQGYIDQELSDGKTTIVVPPGRYRLSPNGNTHLRFANLNDITIIADDVEMICTENVQAIQIANCTNFTLKGLSIDFDPLPFMQGRITNISSDKRTLDVDILDGYSTNVSWNKLEIFDPTSGELSATTYYNVSYEVDASERTMVISKPANYGASISYEKIGDIIVMDAEDTRNIPHAILPNGCTNLVMEDVTLYAGTTFGFFELDCNNSRYINCKVDRRPLATDLVEREVRRMRSNNADAFHSKRAIVGPKYIGCMSRFNGDDGIAINGDYHIVTASNDSVLSVVGKAGKTPDLTVGDSVELVSYVGVKLPNALITSIEAGPALTSTEKNFLQNQKFNGQAGDSYKAPRVYYVTLDRSVHLPMGSVIASSSRLGNGFEIRNCTIGFNRSQGLIVKASNGVIENNTLEGSWGAAVKAGPGYVWLEAGSGNNLTITNNVIRNTRQSAIEVYAVGGNGEVAPIGAHDNIHIIGNTISGSSNPAIVVTSTSNLTLENNTITSTNNDLLFPWVMNNYGRNEDPSREIYINNYEFVSVTGVSIEKCPTADLMIDDTIDLDGTLSPSNAMDKSISWSSDNNSIATVDWRGIVTALSAGTVTITLQSQESGIESQCTVNVMAEPVILSNLDQKYWSVYPNPAKDFIQIERLSETQVRFSLYDLSGQKLLEKSIKPSKGVGRIDIRGITGGIHLLEISDGERISRRRIMIK